MSGSELFGSAEAVLNDGMNGKGSDGYMQSGSGNASQERDDKADDPREDQFWISRARSSYLSSESWFNSSVRRRMEDNMRMFNSEHPRGSKYNDPAYEKRSKLFRPKTRAGVRKMEASTAAAFFSTEDAVACSAPNPRDRRQRIAADTQGELLNYRLQNYIPWYLTCLGAMQDAAKQGVVISKQEWVYREAFDAFEETEIDINDGQTVNKRMTYERRTITDKPDIKIRPVENIRFSPAADWRDPLQTSPYLIDMEPWFVGDLKEKMHEGRQGPTDVSFRQLTDGQIRSTLKQSYDPVRQAREGHREDRYDDTAKSNIYDHDVVWVHHNYMRVDGTEWYYATLGTEVMLTDVVPLEMTTPLKVRPYVMGICNIETHKPYPSSSVEIGAPLQEEINDLSNLRIDNIRHVISPRYFIKRGTSVDIRSLLRNVPGGVTAMEDPMNDVHIRQISDTTASAFQEQDRLAIEYDDLLGSFSQSSVASNHNVNERVGNTMMLGEESNKITEMTVRTFSETWVEPVLQQVMELIRALESDEMVLTIVGQRMGVPAESVFRMMDMPVKVTVNVGFGATNPQRRLQKVAMAFETVGKINPEWMADADRGEVMGEIFGAVGFKSVERFFPALANPEGKEEDPRITQMQQEIEKLQQALQMDSQKYEIQAKTASEQTASRERVEMAKLQQGDRHTMSQQELAYKIEQDKWNGMLMDAQIKREQNAMRKQELVQQRIALNHTITMDERQYELTRQEMEMERAQQRGAPSIPDTRVTSANKEIDSNPGKQNLPVPGGKRIATQPKLAGDDKAGVMARDNYGAVPFEEG